MFNWNAHLRGTGFPGQMPFQAQAALWAQHHQQPGMGMLMGSGWPTSHSAMYPPHGLLPGVMNMPMTPMMGGVGPAPPSQPPPPLPAEPPPPSPKVPPPPPPQPEDSASPVKPEQKKSKWDQSNREQPSSTGSAAPTHQPKPPQSPAPGQPKPPQSPSPSQTRPSHTTALGSAPDQVNPHGQVPGQVNLYGQVPGRANLHGQAPNQVNPHGQAPNQVNLHGQVPGHINLQGQAPNQVNPHDQALDQVNLHGQVPGQINLHGQVSVQANLLGQVPGQVNLQVQVPSQAIFPGQSSGQVNLHGQIPGQVNLHGQFPGQANFHGQSSGHVNHYGLAPGQVNPHGPAPGQFNPPHGAVAGQPLPPQGPAADHVPASHKKPTVPPAEKTVPDPALVAELEKVKLEEVMFTEQYKQWKKQYDDWRDQNQNHPNKGQFEQYLEQWRTYEQQMEVRRTDILRQKQNIEDKLFQPREAPVSKAGPVWMGSQSKLNTGWDRDGQDISSVSPLSQGFSVSSHDRENRLTQSLEQATRESVPGHLQRFDSTGPLMSGMRHQLSHTAGDGVKVPPVEGSSTAEEEKGEEDMNLDDDDEEGDGGGIIESAQSVNKSGWPEKPKDTNFLNQHSDRDWNSWNQGPDIQSRGHLGNQANDFHGPARGTGVVSHRGRGFQEPASFSGSEVAEVDSDSRFSRPAGGSELQKDEDCAREEFDDVTVSSVDGFQRSGTSTVGRGQYRGGTDSDFLGGTGSEFPVGKGDFHRGRGGDFQRGRGGDFHRGRGAEFYRGRGAEFYRGRGAEFQAGIGGEFQRGRGGEFHRGIGGEFHRGIGGEFQRSIGGDFQRGVGGEFQRGVGGEFQRGRGGEFQRGRGGEFQRGRGGEFQRGRGGEFQRGRGGEYESEDGEGMCDHSLDFEHEGFPQGRRGFPPHGRGGLPSLLSFEFNESVRNKFADFEPEDGGTYEEGRDSRGETSFGDSFQGQEGARGKEAQGYFNDDEGSEFLPAHGRGVGVRGGVAHGREFIGSSKGLFPAQLARNSQTDVSLAARGRGVTHSRGGTGGSNHSSFTGGQQGEGYDRHLVQPGREAIRGELETGSDDKGQFGRDEKSAAEFAVRDGALDSVRRQRVDPDRPVSDNTWHDQQEVPLRYDHHNQQMSDTAADRARARPVPGEDEPEVKKRRLSLEDEREDIRVHRPPFSEDPYRLPSNDRPLYRDYRDSFLRDPYLDPYAVRRPYGFDRPGLDRFGPKSSIYDPLLLRKPLVPAESIDYAHGGIDREKKVVQPAKVIDYGHGQSQEGKAAELDLDRDKVLHSGLGDRSSSALLRGGLAEMRPVRDTHELTRVSEFSDRDPSYRSSDVATRGPSLGVPPKYGLRRDEYAGHDHRLYEGTDSAPVSGSSWGGDGRDGDRISLRERDRFGDSRDADIVSLRERDRFREEDDRYRGLRMTRFSSRDDDWKSREDGMSIAGRDTDPVTARRGRYGYSEKDDDCYVRTEDSRLSDSYMDRSGEFLQNRDHRVGTGDSYIPPARDSRYGSSGTDLYGQDDRLDRDGHLSPPAHDITPFRTATPPPTKPEIVKVEDLLCSPNRDNRPPQIVIIIRGLPGSGKTYASKLLREKEISCGGAAPRMLCLDDYFMVDQEREVTDPDTGKKIKKRVLEYEYEQQLEETYRQGLLKSFKKTVDDGFFPFIVVDATNEKVAHFSEFWSYAKSKGFQVYVGEMNADVPTCIQRNIHHWTEWDIEKVKNNWEPLPSHYIRLDLRWLLQEDSIPEVVMEDTQADADKEAGDDDEDSDSKGVYKKSKWELDTSEETLDKLDGIRVSKKHIAEHQSLNDYLQLDQLDDDYFSRESLPGKKRVRWADLEEKKSQSRRRNLGFIVGQTQQDWARITDDDFANKALNQTKYFYKS